MAEVRDEHEISWLVAILRLLNREDLGTQRQGLALARALLPAEQRLVVDALSWIDPRDDAARLAFLICCDSEQALVEHTRWAALCLRDAAHRVAAAGRSVDPLVREASWLIWRTTRERASEGERLDLQGAFEDRGEARDLLLLAALSLVDLSLKSSALRSVFAAAEDPQLVGQARAEGRRGQMARLRTRCRQILELDDPTPDQRLLIAEATQRLTDGVGRAPWLALMCCGADLQTVRRELVAWSCDCAERALPLYEAAFPRDLRARQAIEAARRSFPNPEPDLEGADWGLQRLLGQLPEGPAKCAAQSARWAASFAKRGARKWAHFAPERAVEALGEQEIDWQREALLARCQAALDAR